MQHYISQLLEDILVAKRPANTVEPKAEGDSFEVHIAEVESFLTGEGEQPLREVLVLEEIQFPPTHRLTDAQMASIVSVFEECLLSWNISADMPENIPVSLQYSLFVSTLAKSVFVQGSDFVHLETCPFGEGIVNARILMITYHTLAILFQKNRICFLMPKTIQTLKII